MAARSVAAAALLAAGPAAAAVLGDEPGGGTKPPPRPPALSFAVAAAAGNEVVTYDGRGRIISRFSPYDSGFTGGVRVAVGDIDGDGRADLITGSGPGGGPRVSAFAGGNPNAPIRDFFAGDPSFAGGVFVAAGDVNGDGAQDIITGNGAGGGPQVRVFDGRGNGPLASFSAFDNQFTGGVRVAAGDLNGDGTVEIFTGGGLTVRVFDLDGTMRRSFSTMDPSFTGDVSLATGRYGNVPSLFVGAGWGDAPRVQVYRLADLAQIADSLVFPIAFRGGVNVGFGRYNGLDSGFYAAGSGGSQLLIRSGVFGGGGVRGELRSFALQSATTAEPVTLEPFGSDFTGGLWVAGAPSAVPEPALWLQLIIGFGLAGSALRRRQLSPA